MPKFNTLLAAGVATLLSACTMGAVNLLVPKTGYGVHGDLAFGPDPRQRLDIYVPGNLKGPAPVLLFLYGGAWQSGSRTDYRAFGQAFASAGIIAVVADYRLYPQVKYRAFAEDAAAALAWLHAHVAQYGGDPDRIFVSGHSAGAYNAVMVASEPKFIEGKGGRLGWMRGVIGISGPYDFLPMSAPEYIAMFEGTNNLDSMPLHHVDGKRPPMLLATGTADDTVDQGNTDRMAEKLRAFGSEVKVIKYPGVGHIGTILSLVPGFRGKTSLRRDMIDFISSH